MDATAARHRSHIRRALQQRPLTVFWTTAFTVSWAWWLPAVARGGTASHVPGLVGPAVAGLVTVAVVEGRPGVVALGRRMVRWRVGLRWYGVAVAPLAIGAVGVAVIALSGGARPSAAAMTAFPGLPGGHWAVTFLLVLVLNGYGEEVGWRGVAWPRLRAGRSLGAAALLLTVPWALWHLPLFWLDTGLAGLGPLVVPGWLVGLVAGAVVLGWLYERAGASLFVVALFHACINMASATPGTEGLPAAGTSAAVIAAAVVVLQADRRRRDAGSAQRLGQPGARQ